MNHFLGFARRAPILLAVALSCACVAGVSRAAVTAEGAFVPPTARALAMPKRLLPLSSAPVRVALERLDAARLDKEALDQPAGTGVPIKVGFNRDVPALREPSQAAAMLAWSVVGESRVAAISVVAPGAVGIRLGLQVQKLPAESVLRFYAPVSGQVFQVSGREVMETLARNREAGDGSAQGQTYWSPVIDNEEATLEVELPAGMSPDAAQFAIPQVSHLFSSPVDTRVLQEKIGQSASCNLDAMCYTGTWGNESLAVARMIYTSGASSYLCTGTLLNDLASTSTPYFLSANHCVDTQTVASTLQTYWFYRSTSCNSGVLSGNTQTVTGGAALLYANVGSDTSFMKLNNAPPGGAWLAGWTTSVAALSAAVTGLHNPAGDLQKISFASIAGYASCVPAGVGTFSCTTATSTTGNHLRIVLSAGMVEGGSSGSGLWVASGASHYLVGQLHGGSSTCTQPTLSSFYGRFDVAYNAALHQWLSPPAVPAAATLIAPSGTISGSPTYSWNAVAAATQYYVYLSNGTGAWHTAAAAGCGAGTGTCSVAGSALPSGSYTWFVLTWNPTGAGPWSTGMNFTVTPSGPPPATTLISPSGTITSAPTYQWNAVASSTYYFLYLSNGALKYYTAAEAGCDSGTGTCSVAGLPLVNGAYAWIVATYNTSGLGPWSSVMGFTVASTALPAAATLVSPNGAVSGAPTYTWNAVSNSALYFLYVNGVLTWYLPADAGCGTGLGTCSIAGTALPTGSYTWYVLPWNDNGIGPWSTGMNFSITP